MSAMSVKSSNNIGKRWSKSEDDLLLSEFESQKSHTDIAINHGRSVNAIKLRVFKLVYTNLKQTAESKSDSDNFDVDSYCSTLCQKYHILQNELEDFIEKEVEKEKQLESQTKYEKVNGKYKKDEEVSHLDMSHSDHCCERCRLEIEELKESIKKLKKLMFMHR